MSHTTVDKDLNHDGPNGHGLAAWLAVAELHIGPGTAWH